MYLSKNLDPNPKTLGVEIARAYNWEGDKIFLSFLAALEDSNFHRVSRALIEAWEKVEGPLPNN
jgi:hypothetical protein